MLKYILIAIGVLLACVVTVGLLGGVYIWTAKEVPLTDAEKALVVRAKDLASEGNGFNVISGAEVLTKSRFFDGTESIDYEYNAEGDNQPYISVTITRDRKQSDALASYALDWQSSTLGLGLGESSITVKEDNSVYSAGDRSRLGHIVIDGMTLGHVFVALKGKTTYTIILSNFTLEGTEQWRALFDTRIANLEKPSTPPTTSK